MEGLETFEKANKVNRGSGFSYCLSSSHGDKNNIIS